MENFTIFLKNYMKKEKINFRLYEYEQKFWNENLLLCGIDEVGRGCLAGPIVTSAAILHPNSYHPNLIDSKLLDPETMQDVYRWLMKNCNYNIAINSARIVDNKNIYKATQATMKSALLHLLATTPTQPSLILVDAMPLLLNNTPYHTIPTESLIKGELRSASIAAASIIAKVTRDTIMQRIDLSFPRYNLKQHKGYATPEHQSLLKQHQPALIHRKTFLKKLMVYQKDLHEQTSIFS